MIGLTGASGAGKSTLLRALAGATAFVEKADLPDAPLAQLLGDG